MVQTKWMTLAIAFVATSALVLGAEQSVTTTLNFNVAAVDELTVTLLGESSVTSSTSGTSTPANIEFNASQGTATWVNATVTGGGSTQDSGNPIFTMDNTGTTDLTVNISIGSTLPSCMDLRYSTSWCSTPSTCASDLTTTEVTLDNTFQPSDSNIDAWLWGNFSSCTNTDDTSVTHYINASS